MSDKQQKVRNRKESRAGLVFPVSRIQKKLQDGNYAKRISTNAGIFMSGILEYLTAEVLELAAKVAKESKKKKIGPRHIQFAVRSDEELNKLLAHAVIAEGGFMPSGLLHSDVPMLRAELNKKSKKDKLATAIPIDEDNDVNM